MTQTTLRWKETAAPEFRLLLLCARTQLAPSDAKSILELTAKPLQWDELLSLASRNSVTPLLELHLRHAPSESTPLPALKRLSEMVRATTATNLLLTAELIKLAALFRSQDTLVIPYKGPLLAAQAYGNVALREFDDLDIILRQKDMAKAHEIMLALGYRAKSLASLTAKDASLIPGEYKYYDQSRRILVELHTEFTLRHFPVVPNLEDFSTRLVPVPLGGGELLTFSPEDALPVLCIHGAKDYWERLSWVADLAELMRSHAQLDWDQVLRVAESLKSQRMLFLGLILASGLLDAPVPPDVHSLACKDSVAAALAEEISARLLTTGSPDLDAAGYFSFRRRMLPGFAGWQYAVRLALAPSDEDLSAPRSHLIWAPLSIALRPFRFLRKYGWHNPH